MGRVSLTAAIVNGVIGSGIFGLPSAVAALTGTWSPLAVLIAGACVFLVLLCFAEVGSRFDQAGGPYLYAREAFGPIAGFQVGWLLLVSRLLACAAALNILIVYVGVLAPPMATPTGRVLTMTAAMAIATAINVTGIRIAAWTTNVFTVAKLLPLVLLIVVGLPQLSARVLASQVVANPQWREAVLLLVFAYGGFESMVIAGQRNPRSPQGHRAGAHRGWVIVTVILLLVAAGHCRRPPGGRPLDDAGGFSVARGTGRRRRHDRDGRCHRVCVRMADRLHADDAARAVLDGDAWRDSISPRPRASCLPDAARGDHCQCDCGARDGLVQLVRAGRDLCRHRTPDVFASTCAALLALKRRGARHPRFGCRQHGNRYRRRGVLGLAARHTEFDRALDAARCRSPLGSAARHKRSG
jgi:hypothetical protein